MLLLEYHQSSYTKEEYYSERAISIFYIGTIFYHMKDHYHAVEHLLPIQEQLYLSKRYKELAASEHKISKIWRINFNEQTINWNYFSESNMQNYGKLEDERQASRFSSRMKKAGNKLKTSLRKIHKI